MTRSLYIIEESCGECFACCTSCHLPPFGDEVLDLPEGEIRDEVIADIQAMDGPSIEQDCSWLDRETGQCKHYDLRPNICREFKQGDTDCLGFRKLRCYDG